MPQAEQERTDYEVVFPRGEYPADLTDALTTQTADSNTKAVGSIP